LDYVEIQIEAFLNERKAQNLTKCTIDWYKRNLLPFLNYLDTQQIKFINQITPQTIRDFLLLCSERGHNEGGVAGRHRGIKAFLKWYWDEVEPDYKNPIDKVKAPRVTVEPIEGISREEFNKLLEECSNDFLGIRDKAILMVYVLSYIRTQGAESLWGLPAC